VVDGGGRWTTEIEGAAAGGFADLGIEIDSDTVPLLRY
jgi:hypothetical protein